MTDVTVEIARAVEQMLSPGTGLPADELFDGKSWAALESGGFTLLGIAEDSGGSGGSLADAAAVLDVAGYQAARVPLAETMIAAELLALAGLPIPSGPLSFSLDPVQVMRSGSGWMANGSLRQVPWARYAAAIVALASQDGVDRVVIVRPEPGTCAIEPASNVAGEPRDDVVFRNHFFRAEYLGERPVEGGYDWLIGRGAFGRTVMLAGAARAVLDQTRSYVQGRVQFGRPLAAFQVVQHHLAALAADATAMRLAADVVVSSASRGPDPVAIAAAKASASALAGSVASVGHQLHGAFGFAREARLGLSTARLWAWRDEYGNEAYWHRRLADLALSADGDAWSLVSGATVESAAVTT